MFLLPEGKICQQNLRSRFGLNISLEQLQLTSSCRRQEMCSWVIRPAALVFPFTSSGGIHILSGLIWFAASCFLCAQTSEIFRYLHGLPWCVRHNSADQVPFKCFFITDLFVFLHFPGPCVPPPPSVPLCASPSSQLWLLCRWLFVGASQWV